MEKMKIKKPFKLVGLGGTFDHLHEGHRNLLKTAVKMGEHVAIGLTTDKLLKYKKHYNKIQLYKERKKHLRDFLRNELGLTSKSYTIVPISDVQGGATEAQRLEAHISSLETYENAIKINEMRIAKGITPMTLILIPLTLNSAGKKLSSTDIRAQLD